MLWVRSGYARPLAIAFAWLGAFLPWNVTYVPAVAGGSLLFLRFPFFQVRFAFGVSVTAPVLVLDPLSAVAFQAGRPLELAYQVWVVGAGVILVSLVLASLLYYHEPLPPEHRRIDPVRVMGALLLLAALVLTAATVLLSLRGFSGVPIPVGVVLLWAFGLVLLLAERVDDEAGENGDSDRGGGEAATDPEAVTEAA